MAGYYREKVDFSSKDKLKAIKMVYADCAILEALIDQQKTEYMTKNFEKKDADLYLIKMKGVLRRIKTEVRCSVQQIKNCLVAYRNFQRAKFGAFIGYEGRSSSYTTTEDKRPLSPTCCKENQIMDGIIGCAYVFRRKMQTLLRGRSIDEDIPGLDHLISWAQGCIEIVNNVEIGLNEFIEEVESPDYQKNREFSSNMNNLHMC